MSPSALLLLAPVFLAIMRLGDIENTDLLLLVTSTTTTITATTVASTPTAPATVATASVETQILRLEWGLTTRASERVSCVHGWGWWA